MLRNEYSEISKLVKTREGHIYITKNGENDLVVMDIATFEKREQILRFRAKILQAEQERMEGERTLSIAETRKMLQERLLLQN